MTVRGKCEAIPYLDVLDSSYKTRDSQRVKVDSASMFEYFAHKILNNVQRNK